jgi:predicted DNA-binding transcriptional regulator AlpA
MENHMANAELMTPEEVSDWTGLSRGALAQLRYKGEGPKFIKLGAKTVRYFRGHVQEWLEGNVHQRTGEKV